MENTDKAVRLAIKAGWTPKYVKQFWTFGWEEMPPGMDMEDRTFAMNSIFDDFLFWQSLGKTRGWDEEMNYRTNVIHFGSPEKGPVTLEFRGPQALFEWHRFIDTLASGQTSEKFFADLLAKK